MQIETKNGERQVDVDLCTGCFADTTTCPPSSEQATTIMKCPCTQCIVKPICRNICEEWSEYWAKWSSYVRRYGNGLQCE